MKRTIGFLLLGFWIPVVLAMAFPEVQDSWYMISGFMMMVFGTWGAILLIQDKK